MTGAMAGSPEGVSHAGGLGELLELLGHRVDEGHGEALHQHSERREKSTVSEADAEIEKDRASHHPSQSHVLCCAAPQRDRRTSWHAYPPASLISIILPYIFRANL